VVANKTPISLFVLMIFKIGKRAIKFIAGNAKENLVGIQLAIATSRTML